ncbi:hypothetical protein DI44_10725 [Geobacillus sp. CAMR5420]|nr:hypothetical protein DI44_10725 [Geobacillus sp. CAMR5420]
MFVAVLPTLFAVQKPPHHLGACFPVAAMVKGRRKPDRIAEEKRFVQRLAHPEGAHRQISGEAEQLHPLLSAGSIVTCKYRSKSGRSGEEKSASVGRQTSPLAPSN